MKRSLLAVMVASVPLSCGEQQVGQGNRPPELKAPGAQVVAETELLAFAITATDPDDDPVTLEAPGIPEGALFNAQSGQVLWTPGPREAGTYAFRFTASDSRFSVEATVDVTVLDKNRPPALDGLSDVVLDEGDTLALAAVATDQDDDALSVSAEPLPQGAAFDARSGLFTWMPTHAQQGVYVIVFTAAELDNDPALSAKVPVRITVRDVNRAPTLSAIEEILGKEGEPIDVVLQVSDPDGDPVVVAAPTLPPGAAFEPTARRFTWTPALGQAGLYTVPLTVSDRHGQASLIIDGALIVRVARSNRPPVLDPVPDQVLNETENLVLVLSGRDDDSEQTLAYSAVGLPAGAELDGPTLRWTPGCNAHGVYTVLFTVSDGQDSASRQSSLIVNNTNCPPRLDPIGAQTLREGVPLTFLLSVEDEDVAGHQFTVSGAPGATVASASGLFDWTPAFDQGGDGESDYRLVFTVVDRGFPPLTDTVTETFTVLDQNRAPAFDPVGSFAVFEGEVASILVTVRDPDGDALTDIAVSGSPFTRPGSDADVELIPIAGGLSALFTWRPTTLDGGPSLQHYTLTFTAADGKGGSALTIATLTVKNANAPPTLAAVGDRLLAETQTLTIDLEGTDVDGDSLSYTVEGLPGMTLAGPRLTWSPGCKAAGSYSALFTVSDGQAIASRRATITVTDFNCGPRVGAIGARAATEGQTLSFFVPVVDDDDQAFDYTVSGAAGAVVQPATGLFSWTPLFDQGATPARSYSVVFTVTDRGTPPRSDSATEVITVADANRAPTFDPAAGQTVFEREVASVLVTARDADGDALTDITCTGTPFTIPGSDAVLTLIPIAGGSQARMTWRPTSADGGTDVVDHILTFTARDGKGGVATTVATVSVKDLNLAPVFGSLSEQPAREGLAFSFTVPVSDPDGDAVNVSAADLPGGATFNPSLRRADWTPAVGQAGLYTISLAATDQHLPASGSLTTRATLSVRVARANQPPALAAIPDQVANETGSLSFLLTGSDADTGQTLTYSMVGAPTGSRINGRTFSWTPGCNAHGSYTVQFTVSDGVDTASRNALITVNDVNCPPRLDPIGLKSVLEGALLTFLVSAQDDDFSGFQFSISGAAGASIDPITGLFAWTPAFDQGATPTRSYSVVYRVTDRGSPPLSDTVTEIIAVQDFNRAPAFDPAAGQSVFEREVASVLVTARDPDGDTITDVTCAGPPFTLPGSDAACALLPGTGFIQARFTWRPTGQDGGSDVVDYALTFTARDGKGGTSTTLATVSVKDLNQAPVFGAVTEQPARETTAFAFTVPVSDPDGDAVTLTVTDLPAGATFTAAQSRINWTPAVGQAGLHNVTLTATDRHNPLAASLTTRATLPIRVARANQPPTLAAIPSQVKNENQLVTFTISGADADTGQTLAYSMVGAPAGATLSNRVFSWTPGCNARGSYTVQFSVSDGIDSAQQNASITINDINCAPRMNAIGSKTTQEGVDLVFLVSAQDDDFSGFQYNLVSPPAGAQINLSSGLFEWTPSFTQGGAASQSYPVVFRVTDQGSPPLSDTVTETITVFDSNRAPTFDLVSSAAIQEQSQVTINITARDIDNDTLTDVRGSGAIFTQPLSNATVSRLTTVAGRYDARFTWTPSCRDGGTTSVNYTLVLTAYDSKGATGSTQTTLSVSNINCAPLMTVNPAGDSTSELGRITLNLEATDPDGVGLSGITMANGPANSTYPNDGIRNRRADLVQLPPVNASRRATFTWNPACRDAGSYSIAFTATDFNAGTVTVNSGLNVSPYVCPMTVTFPDAVTGEETRPLSFVARAGDPDGANDPIPSCTNLPAGATSSASVGQATINWTPTCTQEGIHNIVCRATSASGQVDAETVAVSIAHTECPPTLTRLTPWTMTSAGGEVVSLCGQNLFNGSTVYFDDGDTLTEVSATFFASNAPGCGGPGLTFLAPPHSAPIRAEVSVDNHEGSPIAGPQPIYYYKSTPIGGIDWGRARAIAPHPRNPQVYAVAWSSVYYTTSDAGRSWTRGGPQAFQPGYNIEEFLIWDAVSDTLYSAIASSLMYRSTDSARTWYSLPGPPGSAYLAGLTPAKGGGLYAALKNMNTGIWRSSPGGSPWVQVNGSGATALPLDAYVQVLANAPSDPDRLFVALDDGRIFRSTNGGGAWTAVSLSAFLRKVVFDPLNADHVFVLSATGVKVRESADFGQTWVDRPAFRGNSDIVVTRGASDPMASVYVLDAATVESSVDNGATIRTSTFGVPAGTTAEIGANPGSAILGFVPDQAPGGWNSTRPLSTAAFRTTDGGQTWSDASTDLSGSGADRIVFTKNGTAVAISGAMFYNRPRNAPRFQRASRFTQSGSPLRPWHLVASDQGSETVFVLTEGTDNVWRSTDAGMTFTSITPRSTAFPADRWTAGAVIAVSPGRLHAICDLYIRRYSFTSTNDGQTWSEVAIPTTASIAYPASVGIPWTVMQVDPVDPNYIWIVEQAGFNYYSQIVRSTDNGATFLKENPTNFYLSFAPLLVDRYSTTAADSRLLIFPGGNSQNAKYVFFRNTIGATAGSLGWSPRTHNFGNSFSQPQNPVHSIAQMVPDPATPQAEEDAFLAGWKQGSNQGRGLFFSTDRGLTWDMLLIHDNPYEASPITITPDPMRRGTVLISSKDSGPSIDGFYPAFGPGIYELEILLP